MSEIYNEFDNQFGTAEVQRMRTEVKDMVVDNRDVPHGTYEVRVAWLELGKSKNGDPMVKCQFKVQAGEYQHCNIYMNTIIPPRLPYNLHNCNELLRKLSDVPVEFRTYGQYAAMLKDIKGRIDEMLYTYELQYGKNAKGYDTYTITNVFAPADETDNPF